MELITKGKLSYNLVHQSEMVEVLNGMRDGVGGVSLDYEATSLEKWRPDCIAFSFSVVYNDNPEDVANRFYFVTREEWKEEHKEAFRNFLRDREVWVFNVNYEQGMTWRLVKEFFYFDDVKALFVADGILKNRESALKPGAKYYLGAEEWADIPWNLVESLRIVCDTFQKYGVEKWINGKAGNHIMKVIHEHNDHVGLTDAIKACISGTLNKYEKQFVLHWVRCLRTLSEQDLYVTLCRAEWNGERISLMSLPDSIVGEYCVYDSYWTAKLRNHLLPLNEKPYRFFIKQFWLASVFEAYGACWDIDKAIMLDKEYKNGILHHYKTLFETDQFVVPCLQEDPEKLIELGGINDITEMKKIWNPASSKTVGVFYDSMYSSQRVILSMVAYHIFDKCQRYDETMIIDTNEEDLRVNYQLNQKDIIKALTNRNGEFSPTSKIPLIKTLKWYNLKLILPKIIAWVNDFYNPEKNPNDIDWSTECFKEKRYIQYTISDAKKITTWHKGSLATAFLEMFYDAFVQCSDGDPELTLDEMSWEFRIIYCIKLIKKLSKARDTYIHGSLGFKNLFSSVETEKLTDIPLRTVDETDYKLFNIYLNPCSAETKRWRGGVHTIPWGSELRELLIPRREDALVIHYDYSQAEIRLLAAISNCTPLLEAFARGEDIHRRVAAGVFRKDAKLVTDGERRFSKMASFSILYGKSYTNFGLDFMDGDIQGAKKLFDDFFTAFPEIRTWCLQSNKDALENKYCTSLFGDKIYLNYKDTPRGRSQAKRWSQNYPIQHSASNVAGVGIWENYNEVVLVNHIEAIPIGFTHDSSDWECLVKELVKFIKISNKVAVDDVREKYGVPMAIDFELGTSQNFMMGIENPSVTTHSNGHEMLEAEFVCAEVSFYDIIKKLELFWDVTYEVTKNIVKYDSMNELFKTRRAYSKYIGTKIPYLEGKMTWIRKDLKES